MEAKIAELAQRMIAYSMGDLHDIDHFLKVYAYARTIGVREGLGEADQTALEAAALLHDIACPLCREKYGNTNGKHQEREGGPLAAELLRPDCQLFIGEIDGPGVEDYMNDDCWRGIYAEYVKDGFSWEEIDHLWDSNPAQEAAPDVWAQYCYLKDGDVLSYGGHNLRCILTPGHTPGHMCLYDPESQWFFAGDHILFHISPNICRWETMPDALGSYLESLQKVRNLPVKLLLPAHRAETGILAERVDELTAHHLRRIENAWQTVRDEPGLTGYEIAGRMRWKIRSRSWADFPLEQKFFAVGEALAHLDYLEARGRVFRREEGGKRRYYISTSQA